MGKFKKGDRVRLTRNNASFGDAGDTGVIVSPDAGDEDALVRFDREINGYHEWYASWSRLELVPADHPQLTIQAGRHYLTRDGRKVGPMRRWSEEANHRWEADDDDLSYIWADDGTEIDSDIDDGADLVAEAEEPANNNASTAGFTVPVFDDEDEPKKAVIGSLSVRLDMDADNAIEKLDAIIAKLRQIDEMSSELGINLAA